MPIILFDQEHDKYVGVCNIRDAEYPADYVQENKLDEIDHRNQYNCIKQGGPEILSKRQFKMQGQESAVCGKAYHEKYIHEQCRQWSLQQLFP